MLPTIKIADIECINKKKQRHFHLYQTTDKKTNSNQHIICFDIQPIKMKHI